jgi:Flp pilus assembly protein TadG
MTRARRDERGSAAIEMALLAPLLGALVLVVVFGGRVALARQTVQAAAADSARAASIARTADAAERSATSIAEATLANQGVTCAESTVEVDTSGFRKSPGTPAATTVSITCELVTADLTLPIPGTIRLSASSSSALDTYRARG